MKIRTCKDEYLSKAKHLTKIEAERLMSRMGGKLYRRLEKEALTRAEILGIQLEIEDDQLLEWREKMASIKESENKKKKIKLVD